MLGWIYNLAMLLNMPTRRLQAVAAANGALDAAGERRHVDAVLRGDALCALQQRPKRRWALRFASGYRQKSTPLRQQ